VKERRIREEGGKREYREGAGERRRRGGGVKAERGRRQNEKMPGWEKDQAYDECGR